MSESSSGPLNHRAKFVSTSVVLLEECFGASLLNSVDMPAEVLFFLRLVASKASVWRLFARLVCIKNRAGTSVRRWLHA